VFLRNFRRICAPRREGHFADGPRAACGDRRLSDSEQPRSAKTVELCYGDSSWKIDSVSIWRPVWEPFVSIEAIQDFAEEEYVGTKDKWVKVADLGAAFGGGPRSGILKRAYYWLQGWWHFS
jgi:hypothetical protein